MSQQQDQLSEQDSLNLITMMINKAKDSYSDTGVTALMWGAIITICSIEKFLELQLDYRLPFDIYLLTIVAVIPQVIITTKEKKERKVVSFDDVYLDYIWLGFGICIFLMIFIVNMIAAHLNPVLDSYRDLVRGNGASAGFNYYEYVPSLFLLLYGLPTFITGAACKFKPMLWGGILCWVCCIVTLFTPIKIDLLLTALSAIVAWFIPGLLMKREYNIHKQRQGAANV